MSLPPIAMIFPGQGSQAVGMGRELAVKFPKAAALFRQADEILERPLSKLCWEGPEEDLRWTYNTQPALFVASVAALELLRDEGIEPGIVAGHSLGEYSALYAAGVFDFETGLRLVAARGRAMFEAGQARPGAMAAILQLENDQIEAICRYASGPGIVVAANLNSPGQVVVSGDPEAVAKAVELAQEAGSKRSVILPVSGAFHSPLVEPAVSVMREELGRANFQPPRCLFVANISAELVDDVETIREGLARQIVSCVRWTESIETMAGTGAEMFLEVGSGKVLTGLMRRIDRDLKAMPAGTPESIEAAIAALAETAS